jgi:hypothetical protein
VELFGREPFHAIIAAFLWTHNETTMKASVKNRKLGPVKAQELGLTNQPSRSITKQ